MVVSSLEKQVSQLHNITGKLYFHTFKSSYSWTAKQEDNAVNGRNACYQTVADIPAIYYSYSLHAHQFDSVSVIPNCLHFVLFSKNLSP